MDSKYPDKTVLQDLHNAVISRDCNTLSRIVHVLRFHFHVSYEDCFTLANVLTCIGRRDWDKLLHEAEITAGPDSISTEPLQAAQQPTENE